MTFTVGSLFAGIGGFDLGLERAGMRIAWQVENDPFCIKVLTKHWPDVPKYGDIREINPNELEAVDLICGGFPCQDVSFAGKRAGINGERSGLWSEFARFIRILLPLQRCDPTCAFVEEFRRLERRQDKHLHDKVIMFQELDEIKAILVVLLDRSGFLWPGIKELSPHVRDTLTHVERRVETVQLLYDMSDPESGILRKEAKKEERIQREFAEEACL